MSIETEIIRLQTAKANIKSAIEAKWGDSIPSSVKITNYADYVSSAADTQYNSGIMAGGGGDTGNKCVVSSGSVVVASANTLNNAGIASNMTLRVSNGGIASNVVVVQPTANVQVLSGGKLVNPIVLANGTVTISSGGVVSGGEVQGGGYYMGGNNGIINAIGIISGTTVKSGGLVNVSGSAPVISIENGGVISVFDGATVGVVTMNPGSMYGANISSVTVQSVSGSGIVSFISATGVVVSNVDIASGVFCPDVAHFGVVTLRSAASITSFNSSGVIDSLVMAGRAHAPANAYGTIGFVSTMSAGTGLSNFQGTINSAILDKGYVMISGGGQASNVEILSSGLLDVRTSATANGVVVSSCVSYTDSYHGLDFKYGLKIEGSNAIVSNITVLQNGNMCVAGGGFADAPVFSSGAKLYVMSGGSATDIDSKTGAEIYELVINRTDGVVSSSAITDDYFENGCNITFTCPPKVTVKYAGAGTGYEVTGTGTNGTISVNGIYLMYNGDANVYKHETKGLYLVYRNNYYMLASDPNIQYYNYGAYFYNSTGFTSSYNTYNGSGSISVSAYSIQPIGAWSIDNGENWNEYGSTIFTGDAKGSLMQRTITFSSVSGYIAPSPITATMYDRNNVFEVQYMILLTVSVTNVDGAKWSIDGGTTWNNSGESVQVPANSKQTITYNYVSVDGVPCTHESQSIEVTLSTNNVSVEYIQNPGNGTKSDPYLWSTKVDSTIGNTNGCHSILFNGSGRGEENAIWLKAYLTGGITYSIGADGGNDAKLFLNALSGDKIRDDEDGGGGRTIDGHRLSDNYGGSFLEYTPSESGYYLIGGADRSNVRLHCYPAPIE